MTFPNEPQPPSHPQSPLDLPELASTRVTFSLFRRCQPYLDSATSELKALRPLGTELPFAAPQQLDGLQGVQLPCVGRERVRAGELLLA
jgi:hypothetical protein